MLFEAKESSFAAVYGPSMLFVPPPGPNDPAIPEPYGPDDLGLGSQYRESIVSVNVVRLASADEARGRPAGRPDKCFSWGRFIFQGGSKLRGEIHTELCKEP